MKDLFPVDFVKMIEDKFGKDFTFAEWVPEKGIDFEGDEGEIVPNRSLPTMGHGSMLSHSNQYKICYFIYGLLGYWRPNKILVLGTNSGMFEIFVCWVYEQMERLGDDFKIDTIDFMPEIFDNCKVIDEFPHYRQYINRIAGRTDEKVLDLPKNYYDLILIDAAHDFEGALQDLLNCWEIMREDTYILIHDTRNPECGVGQAVKTLKEVYPEANAVHMLGEWQGVSLIQKYSYDTLRHIEYRE